MPLLVEIQKVKSAGDFFSSKLPRSNNTNNCPHSYKWSSKTNKNKSFPEIYKNIVRVLCSNYVFDLKPCKNHQLLFHYIICSTQFIINNIRFLYITVFFKINIGFLRCVPVSPLVLPGDKNLSSVFGIEYDDNGKKHKWNYEFYSGKKLARRKL